MPAFRSLALAAGLAATFAFAALGQGSGAGSTAGAGPSGQGGAPGIQAPTPGSGRPGLRDSLRQQEGAAGVVTPGDRNTQQLRDLNAMSQQLAPSAPLPAPEVATPGR